MQTSYSPAFHQGQIAVPDVKGSHADSERYRHLEAETRTAIREILIDTKQGLPAYWRSTIAALP